MTVQTAWFTLMMSDHFSLDREAVSQPGVLRAVGEQCRPAVQLFVVRGNPTGRAFFPSAKQQQQWIRELQPDCRRLG